MGLMVPAGDKYAALLASVSAFLFSSRSRRRCSTLLGSDSAESCDRSLVSTARAEGLSLEALDLHADSSRRSMPTIGRASSGCAGEGSAISRCLVAPALFASSSLRRCSICSRISMVGSVDSVRLGSAVSWCAVAAAFFASSSLRRCSICSRIEAVESVDIA